MGGFSEAGEGWVVLEGGVIRSAAQASVSARSPGTVMVKLLLWVGSQSRSAVPTPQACWRCLLAVVWRRTAEALSLVAVSATAGAGNSLAKTT